MKYQIIPIFLLLVSTAAAPAAEADSGAIKAILCEASDAWHAPGIAAAIVRDGKVHYLGGVGVRESGSDKTVTEDTLFPIGSCTKAFTATALAILVDEGKASWDDPVRKHLPWFRLDDPLADRDVRLRDLLCHRIGLARHDLLWYRAPWSVEESVRRMAFLERSTSFRSTFEYNNLAYLAAGLAISSIAKQPWHEFVQERLFKPLEMTHAVFTSGEARKAPNHASPHGHDNSGKVVIPWYDDDRQIRASGSIKASVSDLSHWLRFQLDGGKYEGKHLLSADALEETHTGQKTVETRSAAARAAGAIQVNYGLGWYISEYRGHGILEHGGAVDGFRARIVLVPGKKLGLVLLTNLEDMEIVNAAGNNLLDHLLGLEKKDWNAFFKEEHKKAEAARAERLKKRPNPVRGTKPSRELDAYVGTYSEPAYGTVKITCNGDALVLNWSSFQLPLKHYHYDRFVTPPKDSRLPAAIAEEFAAFEMNEDAEFSTLRFLGRKFTRDKSKVKNQEK
ncbi:MAG TPA: serine hydrolase [Gemmataceae bacterium]|jgi:CubicO group peptidase (beta-lactamase class C family)